MGGQEEDNKSELSASSGPQDGAAPLLPSERETSSWSLPCSVGTAPEENSETATPGTSLVEWRPRHVLSTEEEEKLLAAMSQGYQQERSEKVYNCCTCAGSRSSPDLLASDKRIWHTSNMGWWDFAKRRWASMWLMMRVKWRMEKLIEESKSMASDAAAAAWAECHNSSAREIREHAEWAKGLFVKACQSLTSMHEVVPDVYIEEFTPLTEQMPVSTLEEVARVIRRDLRQSLPSLFSDFDREPLGSASIAQVHKARLRGSGEVVAVKVQHDGIDTVITEDINTLLWIAHKIKRSSSGGLDFVPLAEEMQRALPVEVNFLEERRAARRAWEILRDAGSEVVVPRMHDTLFGKHVLVMEYVEAFPVMSLRDDAFCARHSLDKCAVLEKLVEAFGILFFREGLLHLDPHVGNIRIRLDPDVKGGARPVVFDWGLFAELSEQDRLSMAAYFHALANFDTTGLFHALESLGVKIRPDLLGMLLEASRGDLKETRNREMLRQRKADAAAKKAAKQGEPKVDVADKKPLELDGFPKTIANFARMIHLMRGLCTGVDAPGIPVLKIFTNFAREALTEASLRDSDAGGPACAPRSLEFPHGAVEKRVAALLSRLQHQQLLVGGQVCVLQGETCLCDLAAGNLSTVDRRPVQPTTRFRLMGATAGLLGLALLRGLRRRAARAAVDRRCGRDRGAGINTEDGCILQTLVTDLWPGFGGGASRLRLADLLSRSAGVAEAYPRPFHPHQLDELDVVIAHFEEEARLAPSMPQYEYLLQPFLLAKLGKCLSNQESLASWLAEELGPLGLDAVSPEGSSQEALVCRDLPSQAMDTVVAHVAANGSSLVNRAVRVAGSVVANNGDAASSEATAVKVEASGALASAAANIVGQVGNSPDSKDAHSLSDAMLASPLLFDPLLANAQGGQFRAGLSISSSAHGLAAALSAKALREDLRALGALEAPPPAGGGGGAGAAADASSLGWLMTAGACSWTAGGLQVLDLRARSATALLARRQRGYGIVCGFGPFVAHFPDLAPGGVTIAVTVNNVTRGREAVAQIVSEVLAHYGYAASWTGMPIRVALDGARQVLSPQVARLFGGEAALTEASGWLPRLACRLPALRAPSIQSCRCERRAAARAAGGQGRLSRRSSSAATEDAAAGEAAAAAAAAG